MTTTNRLNELNDRFTLSERRDAGNTTILVIAEDIERHGKWIERLWTIISDADGNDTVVTPRGRIVDASVSTDSRIDALCTWLANADI